MSSEQYALGNDWEHERARLKGLEQKLDPVTVNRLTSIGVPVGSECLEIGAGGGSIAIWLSKHIGGTGNVVATDIDTRFLDVLDLPNLEVRQHNIITDQIEKDTYDIVHARALLQHLPERELALHKMMSAVKPGGWVLLEEPDYSYMVPHPAVEDSLKRIYEKGIDTFMAVQRSVGWNPTFASRIYGILRSQRFEHVEDEGILATSNGNTQASSTQRLTMTRLKERFIQSRMISEEEYEKFLNVYNNPSFAFKGPLFVQTWGRKPARQ